MAETIQRTTLGFNWAVRAEDPGLLESFESKLAADWGVPSTADHESVLYDLELAQGGFRLRLEQHQLAEGSLAQIVKVLEDTLPLHLARLDSEKLFIHGLVVCKAGRAAILPRYRFRGRQATDLRPSDLAPTLTQHGFEVLGLRMAALDPTGFVHPFPAPWYIPQGGRLSFRELTARDTTAPLAHVLALEPGLFRSLACQTQAEGLAGALANTVLARFTPQLKLDRLATALENTAFHDAGYSHPDEAAEHILNLFEGEQ